MKASRLNPSIKMAREAGLSVYLEGPPGVGKSQLVAQIAKELEIGLIDIRLPLLDPVDLRGLPKLNGDNKVHWAQPDFLPTEGKGILLLDELPSAIPAVQVAAYQLILDRKLGEYELPKGWTVIGAGNRLLDKAVVHKMGTALRSRFVQLEFDMDNEDWITWAMTKGNIAPEIMAFIRFRPELLFTFDPKRDEKTFACPRTWEFANKLFSLNPSSELLYGLLAGTIGEGVTSEFIGYLKVYRELPNLDLIIKQPSKSPIPKDPSTLYAVCMGLAKKATAKNANPILEYALRLPQEFGVLLVKDAYNSCPAIATSQQFVKFSSARSDLFQ